MIREFLKEAKAEEVFRLAALPAESLDVVLTRRGVDPESLADTRALLAENGAPFSADDLLKSTFTPKQGYLTPFPIGRYGDGRFPVYYAALEEHTCVAELSHHLRSSLELPRYFAMVACRFDGIVLVLFGHETKYPDLVSPTESGYPFCQKLADRARSEVSGLHTPSARHLAGVCVPVFEETSLSNIHQAYRGRFVRGVDGGVSFERV